MVPSAATLTTPSDSTYGFILIGIRPRQTGINQNKINTQTETGKFLGNRLEFIFKRRFLFCEPNVLNTGKRRSNRQSESHHALPDRRNAITRILLPSFASKIKPTKQFSNGQARRVLTQNPYDYQNSQPTWNYQNQCRTFPWQLEGDKRSTKQNIILDLHPSKEGQTLSKTAVGADSQAVFGF